MWRVAPHMTGLHKPIGGRCALDTGAPRPDSLPGQMHRISSRIITKRRPTLTHGSSCAPSTAPIRKAYTPGYLSISTYYRPIMSWKSAADRAALADKSSLSASRLARHLRRVLRWHAGHGASPAQPFRPRFTVRGAQCTSLALRHSQF